MCSPAVVGLQEHLKTPFNPACPQTHTQYTADREQVQLSLSLYFVHVFVCLEVCRCGCQVLCHQSRLTHLSHTWSRLTLTFSPH